MSHKTCFHISLPTSNKNKSWNIPTPRISWMYHALRTSFSAKVFSLSSSPMVPLTTERLPGRPVFSDGFTIRLEQKSINIPIAWHHFESILYHQDLQPTLRIVDPKPLMTHHLHLIQSWKTSSKNFVRLHWLLRVFVDDLHPKRCTSFFHIVQLWLIKFTFFKILLAMGPIKSYLKHSL